MTASRLELSVALSDNPNTRPLLDGIVQAEGLRLVTTAVHPSEMFWRQLRFGEFDVSEMSMSSLIIATARGPTPWVALPVFTTREFFHTRILVRTDAGGGSVDDVNWLLQRGCQVHCKDYSTSRAQRLAQSVQVWVDDPTVPGRQVGWVRLPAPEYVRPVRRVAVR